MNALPPQHRIRVGEPADWKNVADILADGFHDDPVLNWFMPDRRLHPAIFFTLLRAKIGRYRHVYVNAQGTGAALWLPPGVSFSVPPTPGVLRLAANMVLADGVRPLRKLFQAQSIVQKAHPAVPHFYLHAIAVRQSAQGQGVGAALLKTVTRLADRAQQPAYLESSNVRNNPLYERHGFEVVDAISLPHGGPTIWFMLRQPRPDHTRP